MKILMKQTLLALLLFFAFMLLSNSSIKIFAHEQNEIHEHANSEEGLESYSGYGCNNGVDLQVNLSEKTENDMY